MDCRLLLGRAYVKAKESIDPSTQNGALLVNSKGEILAADINRFPRGVKTDIEARWERPLKYKLIGHAETNVICRAAREGIKTDGLIMVCPWAACTGCAKDIIEAGIRSLITHKQAYDRTPQSWIEDIKLAFVMLDEASVEVVMYDGKIGVDNLLHSGQIWNP